MTSERSLRILLVHNRYRQRGGEDAVVDDEHRLLSGLGHQVQRYERHNDEAAALPAWRLAADAVWSSRSLNEVRQLLAGFQPDVVHVHNTLARVSPSVLWALRGSGVGCVATLHNHRLACLEGTFQRDGQVCRQCLGRLPWRGVMAGCYRASRAQSAVLATSLVVHRALGSWTRQVHRFIVLNDEAVDTFAAIGLPRDRLRVRPNFAWHAPPPAETTTVRHGGLYVGRLSREKGAGVLAQALATAPGLQVTVLGDGPDLPALESAGARCLGWAPAATVAQQMAQAAWCVLPSVTVEQFPRVLAEAYASGLPVIASRIGPLAHWVRHHQTGLLVEPGDAAGLAAAMAWADAHPQAMREMGQQAQRLHAERLGPAAAGTSLLQIYREALAMARGPGAR